MLRLASRSRCSRASTAARRRKIKLSQNSTCAKKDRKSTRLNSSHGYISYAVFCLKKKNHVRLGPFLPATPIGHIPRSFVYANARRQLGRIHFLCELALTRVLRAFALLGQFALSPI